MGYALFAQRKLALQGLINSVQLQQTQRSDEQSLLAKDSLDLQADITNLNFLEATELTKLYDKLAAASGNSTEMQQIQRDIEALQQTYKTSVLNIQRKQYPIEMKENAIEMEVKRLDTELTSLQKMLEKIEEAEGSGIDGAVPSFSGIG